MSIVDDKLSGLRVKVDTCLKMVNLILTFYVWYSFVKSPNSQKKQIKAGPDGFWMTTREKLSERSFYPKILAHSVQKRIIFSSKPA
ncbi:hypothetical protein [Vibrio algarum]|uniref:Uncharacterized protein n=1 Tax=Vibrio algarum TaxID=3020714 RepID=A0ABT4YPD4_9VIBR|nr:hypothetical protein [Vibrio sp. KJ40-1]MDB1123417.1 hypothetical protein [Vibrio sp. KJ40-1]